MNERLANSIENSDSFEKVLDLAKAEIKITFMQKLNARAIDSRYSNQNIFSLADSQKIYSIFLHIWYSEYSNAIKKLQTNDFFDLGMVKYLEIQENIWRKYSGLRNGETPTQTLRNEWLNLWKQSITELIIIRKDIDKRYSGITRATYTTRLTPETIFAICAFFAMLIGIALAILIR